MITKSGQEPLLWQDPTLAVAGHSSGSTTTMTQDGPVAALRRFAKRLQADGDAVLAAVVLGWSNGQTQGQINRLKTLKRQMYGRARPHPPERRLLLTT